ncbi:TPA: hypothetical protein LQO36_002353, partial [Staphylococcus pseudintermedius]|nr:hypothetical protein [Staphylococcus pseudintermedius]
NLSLTKLIKAGYKKAKIYETISYNIRELSINEVKEFLVDELKELKEDGEIQLTTELRRLLLLYDILKNKEDSP